MPDPTNDHDRTQRLEALLEIDERIAAMESARPQRTPPWKNAALVAAYGGLLALVPALVTGVAGWLENRRQIELSRSTHEHERTLAYLGLAVDPEATEAARSQVLRFLASLDGDPVGVWAASELELVQAKIVELADARRHSPRRGSDARAASTDDARAAIADARATVTPPRAAARRTARRARGRGAAPAGASGHARWDDFAAGSRVGVQSTTRASVQVR